MPLVQLAAEIQTCLIYHTETRPLLLRAAASAHSVVNQGVKYKIGMAKLEKLQRLACLSSTGVMMTAPVSLKYVLRNITCRAQGIPHMKQVC
jgi:hypothetical protein